MPQRKTKDILLQVSKGTAQEVDVDKINYERMA
jgi:hypothetical protein